MRKCGVEMKATLTMTRREEKRRDNVIINVSIFMTSFCKVIHRSAIFGLKTQRYNRILAAARHIPKAVSVIRSVVPQSNADRMVAGIVSGHLED